MNCIASALNFKNVLLIYGKRIDIVDSFQLNFAMEAP